jgi:HK97 family phage prohead protease
MTETETALVPVEIRAVDDAQRTAVMVVCRYGETSDRTPRRERFMPGAFTKSVSTRGGRVPFTTRHTGGTGTIDKGTIVARPVTWQTADDPELRAVLRFFDTPDGWEAFYRAKDGDLNAGSVGFRALEERTGADGAREVTEAVLHHVALLDRAADLPAYDGPRLLEVRAASDARVVAELLAVKWDAALAERGDLAGQLAKLGNIGEQ